MIHHARVLPHAGQVHATDQPRCRPQRFGDPHRAPYVRRRPARGNAHHHVLGTHPQTLDFRRRPGRVVLRRLAAFPQRRVAAGNHAHHHPRLNVKGRGTLAGVQHAQPARCARAKIDQPPTHAKRPRHCLHQPADSRYGRAHRRRNARVLLVDQEQRFLDRQSIEIGRRGVALFGGEAASVRGRDFGFPPARRDRISGLKTCTFLTVPPTLQRGRGPRRPSPAAA